MVYYLLKLVFSGFRIRGPYQGTIGHTLDTRGWGMPSVSEMWVEGFRTSCWWVGSCVVMLTRACFSGSHHIMHPEGQKYTEQTSLESPGSCTALCGTFSVGPLTATKSSAQCGVDLGLELTNRSCLHSHLYMNRTLCQSLMLPRNPLH